MESYIVRVYRRDKKDPHQLVGIVENAALGEQRPFHTLEELGRILTREEQQKGKKRRVSTVREKGRE